MSYIQKNRVMILGADVNHARVGSMRPSFAAVTGSLDADARRHTAVLQAQSPRLEIIQVRKREQVQGGSLAVRGSIRAWQYALETSYSRIHFFFCLPQDLSNMVQKLLLKFHKTTGSLPHKLIFYRDGVSEGQFKEVLQYEVRCCLFALCTVIRDSVLDFLSDARKMLLANFLFCRFSGLSCSLVIRSPQSRARARESTRNISRA